MNKVVELFGKAKTTLMAFKTFGAKPNGF